MPSDDFVKEDFVTAVQSETRKYLLLNSEKERSCVCKYFNKAAKLSL